MLQRRHIVAIACGGFHTTALTETGGVYAWGGGYFGQLGHGDMLDRKTPKQLRGLGGIIVKQVSHIHDNIRVICTAKQLAGFGVGRDL